MPKFLEEIQLKPLISVNPPREGISLYNDGGVLKVIHTGGKVQALVSQVNGNVDLSDYATKAYVDATIGDINVEDLDMTKYALKTEIPKNTSQLTNNSGFITTSSLTSYAKKTDLPSTTSDLTNDSGFITRDDLPDMTEYASTATVNNNLTIAKQYTDTEITKLTNNLIGTAPETLDTLHEIATVLTTQEGTLSNLNTALNSKANVGDVYSIEQIDAKNFADKTWVGEAIEDTIKEITGGEIDLEKYAKVEDLPTKVSDLEQDVAYLTEHQDISHLETISHSNQNLKDAKDYADERVAALVGSAPETLNTIHELAIEFGKHSDMFEALDSTISNKANKGDVYTIAQIDAKKFATQTWVENKDYATETYVTTTVENTIKGITGGDIDLEKYAKKEDIPTKVSDLTQDIEYLTEHQSLEGYATESWVEGKNYLTEHQSLAGYATENYVNTKVAEIVDSAPGVLDTLEELSAALGDDPNFATTIANQIGTKANASDVYNKTETYTKSEVDAEIRKVSIGSLDLSAYALKSELPTKMSQLTNDSNFVTQNILNRYALTSDIPANMSQLVNDTAFITADYLTNYVTKGELPSVPTRLSQLANDAGYLTSYDLGGYATQTYVQTQIANLVDNAPETLNTINELARALEGQDDVITALETNIGSKANSADVYTKTEIDNKLENFSGSSKVTFRKWEVTV